jgi:methionyl aminopeptidase
MVEVRTDTSIDAMYEAGQVVGRAGGGGLALPRLPALVRAHGFWAVVCASVNAAIVHGIPTLPHCPKERGGTPIRLRDGVLVSIDCVAELGGWAGDSAISLVMGRPRAADLRLIETAERALAAGIEAAEVGNRIGDIARRSRSLPCSQTTDPKTADGAASGSLEVPPAPDRAKVFYETAPQV